MIALVQTSALISEVIDRISRLNILSVYEKYMKQDLEDAILSIYEEKYHDKDIKDALRIIKRNSLNRTKRRWVNSTIQDYENKKKGRKELAEEYDLLEAYYTKYGEKAFKQQFHSFSSPTEVIASRIEEITQWSEDDSQFLSDYRYIHAKTRSQIEKALHADIAVILGITLTDNSFSLLDELIIESPFSTVEHPFFSNTRGKVQLNQPMLEREGKHYFQSYYDLGDGTDYQFLIEKEYVEEHGNKVSDLDRLDYKIFLEVMSNRDERFASRKIIEIKIGDLVKNLYKTDGTKNYKIVEERITKMKHFSMTKRQDDDIVSYGIFDFVRIYTQPNGTRVAEIHVNEVIYHDYIQKQTIRMYKKKVENLSLDSSYHLLFALQKERLYCYESKSSYQVKLNYIYFATKIRFKKRRKSENLKEVEEALEELISQKIVVQSYRRMGEVFWVTFIPLEEKEVRDLLEGKYEYMPIEYSNYDALT
ncbi:MULTISPECIES: hypothetical protein [Bacillaceae]|uniref:hypothetical protein n=1 Tax=Bacillaceae TaxID=186817 RepID=UPI001FE39EAC|nr:hypothetical protein [Ectobacillus funiculus]